MKKEIQEGHWNNSALYFHKFKRYLWKEAVGTKTNLNKKTQEFVRTYLRVFVPGLSYAVTSLGVFASFFFSLLITMSISGRGYSDILGAVSSVEPLRNLLEKADPSWGNAAIALIGCEALGPVILAITLALTPKTMDALQTKLAESGWGEENIEERAAEILNLTS
mmetsp:Transcript_4074/g.5947  ORF Transcript_4074/g.5947 Transcript_4074/m.5947 type:complete len:165 (+) Transcript_4074:325-819(+)